jgi:S1-C subfamily serine protease
MRRVLFRSALTGLVSLCLTPTVAPAQKVDVPLKLETKPIEAPETVSEGSAFWVDNSGSLLTAAHVVDGCHRILIIGQGMSQPASVVAVSGPDDLALLQTAHTTTMPVVMAATDSEDQGEPVLAASFNALKTLKGSKIFANGIVQKDSPDRVELILIAEPGASGAAVLNRDGLLQGMLRSKSDAQYASNGAIIAAPHVSAVPASRVRAFLTANHVAFRTSDQPQLTERQSLVARAATLTQGVFCWK